MSHTYCTSQRPFGCPPILSDPGVMLWAMPRIARLDGLDELLEKQLSVVSRGQLLALGVTDHAMQYRVRRGGPWQVLLPGVYLAVSGTPSLRQMAVAGIHPLHFSPHDIRTDPATVIKSITDALESGRNRPPLPIRTVPYTAASR